MLPALFIYFSLFILFMIELFIVLYVLLSQSECDFFSSNLWLHVYHIVNEIAIVVIHLFCAGLLDAYYTNLLHWNVRLMGKR